MAPGGLVLSLKVDGVIPTDLAFDVILETGWQKLNLGGVHWEQGKRSARASFEVEMSDLPWDRVGVILRPDQTAEVEPAYGYGVWEDDVRFEDITVHLSRKARYGRNVQTLRAILSPDGN